MKKYIGIIPLAFILFFSWWLYIREYFVFEILDPGVCLAILIWTVIVANTAFRSRKETSSKIKLCLIVVDVASLICIAALPRFSVCDAEEMAKHYEAIRDDLDDLDSYVRGHVNEGKQVYLEFDGKTIRRFSVADIQSDSQYVGHLEQFDSKDKGRIIDSIRQEAGLDESEIKIIREKLKNVGCFAVNQSSEYCDFTYKLLNEWTYLDGYVFRVHRKPFSNEYKSIYYKQSAFVPYDERCVFISKGINEWPKEKKERFMKSNPKFVMETD